jgi:hypothetical protein
MVKTQNQTWTVTTVVNMITSLPTLQELHLDLEVSYFPLTHLKHLCGLRKITLLGICHNYHSHIVVKLAEVITNSPQLMHLEMDTYLDLACEWESIPPTMFHDILKKVPHSAPLRLTHLTLHAIDICIDLFTLPHLCFLVSLNLHNLFGPEDSPIVSEIYMILSHEHIYSNHIMLCHIDDAILNYLESHSRPLKKLKLWTIHTDHAHSAFMKQFLMFMLLKHAKFLILLMMFPIYDGLWCYDLNISSVL